MSTSSFPPPSSYHPIDLSKDNAEQERDELLALIQQAKKKYEKEQKEIQDEKDKEEQPDEQQNKRIKRLKDEDEQGA
jgi:hypothetical protein